MRNSLSSVLHGEKFWSSDNEMKFSKLQLFSLVLLILSKSALGAEGYSSPSLGSPAKLSYRAFTIYTGQEACEKTPEVASLRIRLNRQMLRVGDKLQAYYLNDAEESDLIIEAFDLAGNFIPSVPISAEAFSIGRTANYDPGIIYMNSSMNFWEARKPGHFAVTTRWYCGAPGSDGIRDEVIIEVREQEN